MWTGAQPIFAARPASRRTYATTATSGSSEAWGSERHVSVSMPAAACGRLEHQDPEQGDAEPERGEDEVLPAGLECPGTAAEADEEGGGGGGRLDREPGGAEVPGERHREQDRPEREERRPVDAVGAVGPERATPRRAGEELRRDEGAREADEPDHADHDAPGRVDDDPAPELAVGRLGESDGRERECGERGEHCDRRLDAGEQRAWNDGRGDDADDRGDENESRRAIP